MNMLLRAALIGLALAGGAFRCDAAPAADAGAVKAALVLNLARFTTWPATSGAGASDELIVGVVGDASLADHFARVLRDQVVNGRRLVVSRFPTLPSSAAAHVVFVPGGTPATAANCLKLATRGVLLVGEDDGFLGNGGHVQLVVENNRLRFSVSRAALLEGGLSMSAQLLRLAMSHPEEDDRVVR